MTQMSQEKRCRKKGNAKQTARKKKVKLSEGRMKGAIAEYREIVEAGNTPKLRFWARAWNVPKSTLQRR